MSRQVHTPRLRHDVTARMGRLAGRVVLPAALGVATALPALAHPHVYVSAEIAVIVDQGVVQAVQLDWLYDDFFSFVLTSDLGIDLDGDMMLEDGEFDILSAAVLDWPEGYTGDLSVMQDGAPLDLGPREDMSVRFAEGRVSEHHTRPLDPATATPIEVAVFDPFYYTAYEIVGQPQVVDRAGEPVTGCSARIVKADLDAAYALVEDITGRAAENIAADEDFPEVGEHFADRVIVTCDA